MYYCCHLLRSLALIARHARVRLRRKNWCKGDAPAPVQRRAALVLESGITTNAVLRIDKDRLRLMVGRRRVYANISGVITFQLVHFLH